MISMAGQVAEKLVLQYYGDGGDEEDAKVIEERIAMLGLSDTRRKRLMKELEIGTWGLVCVNLESIKVVADALFERGNLTGREVNSIMTAAPA